MMPFISSSARFFAVSAMVLAFAAPAAAQSLPKGDAAKGEKLFAQCKICHSLDAGKNGLGPSLKGITGRKAAAVPGFKYSPAMTKSGLTWNTATLADYLTAPMKKVPGTKMAFGGMSKPQDRADVIAYLAKN
jgi:cytochrome c